MLSLGRLRADPGLASGRLWARTDFESTFGRPSVDFGPTSGRLRADFGPTLGRLRADFGPTSGRLWVDFGPTSGRLRSDLGATSGRLWADIEMNIRSAVWSSDRWPSDRPSKRQIEKLCQIVRSEPLDRCQIRSDHPGSAKKNGNPLLATSFQCLALDPLHE